MKNLNCKNCGGTMYPDASGLTAVCRYCGTKYVLNHEDTDYYQQFYRQMNRFFSASTDERERKARAEALWQNAETQHFDCADGSAIEISFMHRSVRADVEIFVTRRNILLHFLQDGAQKAERLRRTVSLIEYPSADTRGLAAFFPRVSGGFALADGTYILALEKDEDEYPLRLFGTLPARHTSWVISRMENICCVLEYNGLVHPAIDPDTLYINPYTHQACLYGGWWTAARNNDVNLLTHRPLQMRDNLTALRDTAAVLLGFSRASDVRAGAGVPTALADFIRSAPKSNAYDDFAFWDDTLMRAFGERKFVTMDSDDESIYGKKG